MPKRMRRKNGSMWCRTIHRLRGYWYDATQSTRLGPDRWRQQKATFCQLCHAWYPRGKAFIVADKAIETGNAGPHTA